MTENDKILTLFTTRIRQMILQYKATKKENEALCDTLAARDARIRELETQLEQARHDYECLKLARMIEVGDADIENARKRISKLIRDVNKCITLLSEQ